MIPKLAAHLLGLNNSRVLIYEYDGRRISRNVKVYDPATASEDERQEAHHKLNQMRERRDLSVERYEPANIIVGA